MVGPSAMSEETKENSRSVPDLLDAVDRGEEDAIGRLVAAVYPELKRVAHFQLASERSDHTLNTTAIVHEAFIRLSSGEHKWNDRRHFLRAAAAVMRHLLVDHARMRRADKRGGGQQLLELDEERVAVADDGLAILALDNALKNMAEIDSRWAHIVEYRYFAGLSMAETAEAIGVSVRTVEREWRRAKGYLIVAMNPDSD